MNGVRECDLGCDEAVDGELADLGAVDTHAVDGGGVAGVLDVEVLEEVANLNGALVVRMGLKGMTPME